MLNIKINQLVIILLLTASFSITASQENIGKGKSPSEVISWTEQYENLHNKATISNNKSAKFKVVQLIDICAFHYDSSVQKSCEKNGVGSLPESLDLLIALAESGFVPAQIYYSKSLPKVYDISNESEILEYETLRQSYLEDAVSKGSGEAMFLLARNVRRINPNSVGAYEQAMEAYSYASASIQCGYSNINSYGLLNNIVEKYEIKVADARELTTQLVDQYCDKGGDK